MSFVSNFTASAGQPIVLANLPKLVNRASLMSDARRKLSGYACCIYGLWIMWGIFYAADVEAAWITALQNNPYSWANLPQRHTVHPHRVRHHSRHERCTTSQIVYSGGDSTLLLLWDLHFFNLFFYIRSNSVLPFIFMFDLFHFMSDFSYNLAVIADIRDNWWLDLVSGHGHVLYNCFFWHYVFSFRQTSLKVRWCAAAKVLNLK